MATDTDQIAKALAVEHQGWLQHPMTVQMLKVLDQHEKRLVSLLVLDLSPTEPNKAHHHGVEIKAARDVRDLLTKTELFVARAQQR